MLKVIQLVTEKAKTPIHVYLLPKCFPWYHADSWYYSTTFTLSLSTEELKVVKCKRKRRVYREKVSPKGISFSERNGLNMMLILHKIFIHLEKSLRLSLRIGLQGFRKSKDFSIFSNGIRPVSSLHSKHKRYRYFLPVHFLSQWPKTKFVI